MATIQEMRDKLVLLSRQRKATVAAGKVPRHIDAEMERLRFAILKANAKLVAERASQKTAQRAANRAGKSS